MAAAPENVGRWWRGRPVSRSKEEPNKETRSVPVDQWHREVWCLGFSASTRLRRRFLPKRWRWTPRRMTFRRKTLVCAQMVGTRRLALEIVDAPRTDKWPSVIVRGGLGRCPSIKVASAFMRRLPAFPDEETAASQPRWHCTFSPTI